MILQLRPLVSIIVPVYNAVPYLSDCLASLARQSYDNIEIVLVDDGSTDQSGPLCDSFALAHKKSKVFHIKNCGLSGARNYGLEHSDGEFILFVDADDYVADDCIQTAINAAEAENADAVLFQFCLITEGSEASPSSYPTEPNFPYGCFTGMRAVELLFENKFANYSWRQLVRRSLYMDNDIRFPVGRVYEDRAVTYRVLFESRQVVFVRSCLYSYRQHENSIVHTISYRNLADDYTALCERKAYICANAPSLYKKCLANTYEAYIGIYRKSLDRSANGFQSRLLRKSMLRQLRWRSIFCLEGLPLIKRLQLTVIKLRLMPLCKPVIDVIKCWSSSR